jgi:hypothetical protein
MTLDWYCETYRCKMNKSACDKRKKLAATQYLNKSWNGRDMSESGCGKCTKGTPIMTEELKKKCKKCHVFKLISDYPPNKECKDGHEGSCYECKRVVWRANDIKKREKRKADKEKFETIKKEIADESRPCLEPTETVVNADSQPVTVLDRGPKETSGKPDWSVFPFAEAVEVVRVFEYGARKYGAPFTYRRGIPPAELWSATMRHLIAIQNGEHIDPESHCQHMAHIAANALMALSGGAIGTTD